MIKVFVEFIVDYLMEANVISFNSYYNVVVKLKLN